MNLPDITSFYTDTYLQRGCCTRYSSGISCRLGHKQCRSKYRIAVPQLVHSFCKNLICFKAIYLLSIYATVSTLRSIHTRSVDVVAISTGASLHGGISLAMDLAYA